LTTASITGGCGSGSTGKAAIAATEVVAGTALGTMGSIKKIPIRELRKRVSKQKLYYL
jgi:hypothetical protein